MQTETLRDLAVAALEDMKAVDIQVLNVRDRTTITDTMVVASGNSNRHVKSLSDNVIQKAKAMGLQPLGVEGQDAGEWVLVDLGGRLVLVIPPKIRDFYQLEKLWTPPLARADEL